MGRANRVLIVDDEPNVRLVLRTALESTDLTVCAAADGETALGWLSTEAFALVLLDLGLPGLDGMDVLARLRESGNDTPVVILSAFDSVPNVVQAMRLGAVDFLPKPPTPETLRRVVADVLGRVRAARAATTTAPVAGPPRAPDRLAEAKRALNRRRFRRAEVLLREAIKGDPSAPEPHYLRGVLLEVRNRPRSAAQAYRDALRADPGYEPARLNLLKFDPKG